MGFNVYEKEEKIEERQEQTDMEDILLRAIKRDAKNELKDEEKFREGGIRNAVKKVANATFERGKDGEKLTVAEKASIACWSNTIITGNTKSLVDLAKISGDLVDKQEVKVSGLEELLEKVTGDSKF